jgi:hypothetical protein
LECLVIAYISLALNLAVKLIIYSGVEIKSLVITKQVLPAKAGLLTPSTPSTLLTILTTLT